MATKEDDNDSWLNKLGLPSFLVQALHSMGSGVSSCIDGIGNMFSGLATVLKDFWVDLWATTGEKQAKTDALANIDAAQSEFQKVATTLKLDAPHAASLTEKLMKNTHDGLNDMFGAGALKDATAGAKSLTSIQEKNTDDIMDALASQYGNKYTDAQRELIAKEAAASVSGMDLAIAQAHGTNAQDSQETTILAGANRPTKETGGLGGIVFNELSQVQYDADHKDITVHFDVPQFKLNMKALDQAKLHLG